MNRILISARCLGAIVIAWTTVVAPAPGEAGPWTLPREAWFAKLTAAHQDTGERFAATDGFDPDTGAMFQAGDRVPYFFDGQSTTFALVMEGVYGLFDDVEFGAKLPWVRSEFTDQVDPERPPTSGIGDLRFYGKYRVVTAPVVLSLEVGAKAPTGKSQSFGDAEVVPTGEGQWDFEGKLWAGRSLWPRPAYVQASVGYRIRTQNVENGFDPGDELLLHLQAGYGGRPVSVQLRWDWLLGESLRAAGQPIDQRRELMSLTPQVNWMFSGGWHLEAGVNFFLQGQDYPAGRAGFLALAYSR